MSTSDIPRRLVCCVDGTYCTPDGPNVYRIFVSVKEGRCFDEVTQQEFIQEKIYEEGLGSADDMSSWDRAIAGYGAMASRRSSKRFIRDAAC